ncbi:MAG TPA: hypothetical protein VK849_10625 [Longimicrobiales bacterium]|nr:hypothetical protein [Longimicrobiales bacterium]
MAANGIGRLLAVVPPALMFALVAPIEEAQAIPAFARKYSVTCSLCHQPAPRLNEFGEMFAGNGFRLALGEPPVGTLETGDGLLRLMQDIPLAVRVDAYMRSLSGSAQPGTDFQTPWGIKLLSGGEVTEKISYYMYFFLTERGEVAGLEDAYVQFSDIAGSGVDLLVGQFQVSDPLFKRELRLEYEDYQAYRVRVGDTRADLTYDRGLMALYSPWEGADLSLQLVNGQGLSAASESKAYDRNGWKTFAARFSQGLGPVRVGGFGYWGLETANDLDSEIRVFGPDVTVALGSAFELNGQYLHRTDERPFFTDLDEPEAEVDMGFAELVYAPQGPAGRWFFTALYNHVEADTPVFTVRQGEEGFLDRYRAAAVGANYLLARNVRLTGEVQRDLEVDRTRLVVGFVTAF